MMSEQTRLHQCVPNFTRTADNIRQHHLLWKHTRTEVRCASLAKTTTTPVAAKPPHSTLYLYHCTLSTHDLHDL